MPSLSFSLFGLFTACGGSLLPADSSPDTAGSAAGLVINEFMASNQAFLVEDTGDTPDWLELYNPGHAAVSLDGHTITDDLALPDKHVFAAGVEVPAGGHLLLWARGATDHPADLGFRLSSLGEEIGLYAPDGTTLDEVVFGEQRPDVSEARQPDGAEAWEATSSPTPGEPN